MQESSQTFLCRRTALNDVLSDFEPLIDNRTRRRGDFTCEINIFETRDLDSTLTDRSARHYKTRLKLVLLCPGSIYTLDVFYSINFFLLFASSVIYCLEMAS